MRFHDEAATLLAVADPFFRADPFSANVIAVVAARVVAGARIGDGDPLWITVEDPTGKVLGAAMQTPPSALFVSRMPAAAAATLAEALADAGRELPGVSGERGAAAGFAGAWAELTGHACTLETAMRMYRLERLNAPAEVPGAGRRATSAAVDLELVADWLAAFHAEARSHAPAADWPALARLRVAGGEVHLWCEDGVPVSLAAVSPPAAGVARIGPVFTPRGSRRQGYGAAVTAAATAAAIAGGAEHVALYTDLANPTSNSIYQAIGYRADHDAEERSFKQGTR